MWTRCDVCEPVGRPANFHNRVGGAVGEAKAERRDATRGLRYPGGLCSLAGGRSPRAHSSRTRHALRATDHRKVESGLGRDAGRRAANFSPRSAQRATTHRSRARRAHRESSERRLRVPIASVPSPPPSPFLLPRQKRSHCDATTVDPRWRPAKTGRCDRGGGEGGGARDSEVAA